MKDEGNGNPPLIDDANLQAFYCF